MRVTPWIGLALWAAACTFDAGGINGSVDATDAPPDMLVIDTPSNDPDGDGVRDPNDNCPTTANADQHDEDGDAVGDRCDNCPTVGNGNQQNTGETGAGQAADGAGDACDPFPTRPGNDLLFFDMFNGDDPLWRSSPPGLGVWIVGSDAVTQTDPAVSTEYYYAGD